MRWTKVNDLTISNGLYNITKANNVRLPFTVWCIRDMQEARKRNEPIQAHSRHKTAELAKAAASGLTAESEEDFAMSGTTNREG